MKKIQFFTFLITVVGLITGYIWTKNNKDIQVQRKYEEMRKFAAECPYKID